MALATDLTGVHPGQDHVCLAKYMCCGSCDPPGMPHKEVDDTGAGKINW